MDELNIAFNKYIEEYKKLTVLEKREELIKSIKELIAGFEKIASVDNIELHYLRNREINDLKGDSVSEDDFLEGTLVYIEVAKNIIGEYLGKKGI